MWFCATKNAWLLYFQKRTKSILSKGQGQVAAGGQGQIAAGGQAPIGPPVIGGGNRLGPRELSPSSQPKFTDLNRWV